MISNQSLTCPKGTSLTFEIDMDTGSDLTGATAQWALCESWFDQAKVYLTKTGVGDGLFINQDAGVWKITVNLAPADTLDVPSGLLYHDCKVLLQSGDVEDVANGPFSLDPSVNILNTNAPITRNLHAVQLLGRLGQTVPLTVAWLARNLLATQSLIGLGQSAAGTVTGGGVSPTVQADFTALTSLPSWLSLSRASNAMVTDSTGNLTYAPNNQLTQTADLTSSNWNKDRCTVASGVSDPVGGTNAWTLTATSATGQLYQQPSASSQNCINSVWLRRRTGTGTVSLRTPGNTDTPVAVTGTWTQFYFAGAWGGSAGLVISIATSGDAVDVYTPVIAAVTYETTPRTADQVITTVSTYYGPRFDHAWNGAAWVASGLLIEEQRTNYIFPSTGFTGSWSSNNVTNTSTSTTAPDGTTSGVIEVKPSGAHLPVLYLSENFVPIGDVTISIFAQANTYTKASLRSDSADGALVAIFDLVSGTVLHADTGMTATVENDNGWWRIIATRHNSASQSVYHQFGPVDDGYSAPGAGDLTLGSVDSTKGVYFWGAQMEPGSFATSYIPTTTVAVTRSADIAVLTGAALTTLRGAAYSIVLQTADYQPTPFGCFIGIDNFSGDGIIRNFSTSTTQIAAEDAGQSTNLTVTIGGGGTNSSPVRVACGTDNSGTSIVANNGTLATNALQGPNSGAFYLGSNSGATAFLDVHFTGLAIYSSRLSDADLQTKSVVGASF